MRVSRSAKLTNVSITAALGILLAGCANNQFATLKSAGQSLPQAQYRVLGKTRYDQLWIDKTIEVEVASLGHKRPAARPAALDASPRSVKAIIMEQPEPGAFEAKTSPVVTVQKPTVWQRVRHPIKTYRQRRKEPAS